MRLGTNHLAESKVLAECLSEINDEGRGGRHDLKCPALARTKKCRTFSHFSRTLNFFLEDKIIVATTVVNKKGPNVTFTIEFTS